MNLAMLAKQNISKFGEYVSLIFEDTNTSIYEEYTNIQFYQISNRFAKALVKLGVQKGDRVSVILPNSPYVIKTFQAILKAGAAINPIIFALSKGEISYILNDASPACIVTSPELYEKVKSSADEVHCTKHIVVVGDKKIPGALSFDELIEESTDQFEIVDTDDHDLAIVMYTSGTTGFPKGVMLTHRNVYSNITMSSKVFPLDQTSTQLCVLPLNHTYGVTLMNGSYLFGSKVVLHTWFNPEATLQAIAKHRVTYFAGVPTMYIMLLNTYNPQVHDTSSIKDYLVAAAPIPVDLLNIIEEKLGGKIYQGYGLTEAAPTVSLQRREIPLKKGSVGLPLPGITVKIFDDNDQEVPRRTWGEVAVQGENVMKGYLNKPKETAEALRNDWLHTGDIGYMDEDGELYITDRKKDLIIRGGENISPSEIEEVIFKHPGVLEVSVIGVPDPKYGEEVKAVVVPKPGQTLTEQEIIGFCLERIARFRCPRSVAFVESLPKSLVGKVLKRELRKQFTQ